MLDLIKFNEAEVKGIIEECQRKNHVQQVAYSTYHGCLTQICFSCEMVRTNLTERDFEKAKVSGTDKTEVKNG